MKNKKGFKALCHMYNFCYTYVYTPGFLAGSLLCVYVREFLPGSRMRAHRFLAGTHKNSGPTTHMMIFVSFKESIFFLNRISKIEYIFSVEI